MKVPDPLEPGGTLRVISTASPPGVYRADAARSGLPDNCTDFDWSDLWSGLAYLQSRYRLSIDPTCFRLKGYLAGEDLERANALQFAWSEAAVALCARGGYGSQRLATLLDWTGFRATPRWIVGFSDVTFLHLAAFEHGVCSLHGANATSIRTCSAHARFDWITLLERSAKDLAWRNLQSLAPRRLVESRGRAWGGNLSLVYSWLASGKTIPENVVLFLEDVTERPYRIDRMLTAIRQHPQFTNVAAVVFGAFSKCDPGPDGTTVETVLAEFARDVSIPVVSNAPFGHVADNRPFVHGSEVNLKNGTLRFLVPA